MLEWKDVLQLVGSTLGDNAGDCILEFLRVLPEEVTEGRKINLSVCPAMTPPVQANAGHFFVWETTVSNAS